MSVRLFRPVGVYELVHVAALDFRAYPPRLPEQPIFYPVLHRAYAEEIASRWNPPDPNSGFAGFVTTFVVPDEAAARFPKKVVGAARHEELWVPAEDQAWLESMFEGPIEVVSAWAGPRLRDALPSWRGEAGAVPEDALEQLVEAVATGPVVGGPLTEGR
jgi:hypothetical protein